MESVAERYIRSTGDICRLVVFATSRDAGATAARYRSTSRTTGHVSITHNTPFSRTHDNFGRIRPNERRGHTRNITIELFGTVIVWYFTWNLVAEIILQF